MIKNNCEITYIKGIGEKRAQLYSKLGINSLEELITYYPRDYIDYSDPKPINELENGETCVFKGTVTKKLKPYFSGKITIYHAVVSDDTDEMLLTFFNTQFSFDKLVERQSYLFYGKVTCDFAKKEVASPLFIPESSKNVITPKYPLTKGLSNNIVSQNI